MANQDTQMENAEDFTPDSKTINQSDQVYGNEGENPTGNGNTETPDFQSNQVHGNGGENPTGNGNGETSSGDGRKLFVGGLTSETTDTHLREYFGTYGDIESIYVKMDPNTQRSKGFAFIIFKTSESIDKIITAGDHLINNKKVDAQKAKGRHGKIFVGGLSEDLTNDDIKSHFNQFGNIIEIDMPFDKIKNQRKSFCFITFESERVANDLLKTAKQTINGKEVDVKRATPKSNTMGSGRGSRNGGVRNQNRGPRRDDGGYQVWTNNQGYGAYSGYEQSYGAGYDYYENDGYNQLNYGNYASGGYRGSRQRGGRNQRRQNY